MKVTDMTAVELSAAIRDGQVTAVEAAEEMLARIEERDGIYNCYVTVDREGALAQARAVQEKIDAGELTGPLAGVPVAMTVPGSRVMPRLSSSMMSGMP